MKALQIAKNEIQAKKDNKIKEFLVLRNNVHGIVDFKQFNAICGANDSVECVVSVRMARINSTKDAMHFETVLTIPETPASNGQIYLLAISEAFHKFDVLQKSRNYKDALTQASEQMKFYFNMFLNAENEKLLIKDVLRYIPITRQCDYFNIGSFKWCMECHEYAKDKRYVVYGKGQAWDFGSDKFKAEKHFKNLQGKEKKMLKA